MNKSIKSTSLIFLASIAFLFTAGLTAKETPEIYLLIGQSNMAGRAALAEADLTVIEGCVLLNDKEAWEPAKNPLNRYSTIRKGLGMQKMGPGYGFAQEMHRVKPRTSIGLVVNAKGGSKIEQWKKGGKFYDDAVRRAKAAQKNGTIKGILWHQGESNQKNPEGYLDKLAELVANLRSDLGSPDLPFVAGQVNNVPAVNEQIAKLPKTVSGTSYVSSEGLTATDRWHFDPKSSKLLGKRYATEILKLQGSKRR